LLALGLPREPPQARIAAASGFQPTADPEDSEEIPELPLGKGNIFAPGEALPFLHRYHVPRNSPTPQDCRRCHSFDGPGKGGYAIRAESCYECHLPGPRVDAMLAENFQVHLGGVADRDQYFDHSREAHAKIHCITCHPVRHVTQKMGAEGRVVEEIEFGRGHGLKACAGCHDDHNLLVVDEERGLQEGCAKCHISDRIPVPDDTAPAGRFRHRDHLKQEGSEVLADFDPADPQQCLLCHSKATDIGWVSPDNYREMFLEQGACGGCHQTLGEGDEGPVPMLPRVIEDSVENRAHIDFHHEQHWRLPEVQQKGGCLAMGCHAFSGGEPIVPAYDGCVLCHDDRTVSNHGRRSLCSQCHGEQYPEGSATPRMAAVHRHRDGLFFLERMHHPQITTLGEDLGSGEDRCSRCHRGVEALIRERGRPFNHWFHVADHESQEGCLRCHENILDSEDSLSLKTFAVAALSDVERSGSAPKNDCTSCHQGSTIAFSEPGRFVVPSFSHRDHLRTGGTDALLGLPRSKRTRFQYSWS
jgi:hypothetical protein